LQAVYKKSLSKSKNHKNKRKITLQKQRKTPQTGVSMRTRVG
jgi:hypothetical protein